MTTLHDTKSTFERRFLFSKPLFSLFFFNWSKHSGNPPGIAQSRPTSESLRADTFYGNEEKDLSAVSVAVLKRVAGNRR